MTGAVGAWGQALVLCLAVGVAAGTSQDAGPWSEVQELSRLRYPDGRFLVGLGESSRGPEEARERARAEVSRQVSSHLESSVSSRESETRRDGRTETSSDAVSEIRTRTRFEQAELLRCDLVREKNGRWVAAAALDRGQAVGILARGYEDSALILRGLWREAVEAPHLDRFATQWQTIVPRQRRLREDEATLRWLCPAADTFGLPDFRADRVWSNRLDSVRRALLQRPDAAPFPDQASGILLPVPTLHTAEDQVPISTDAISPAVQALVGDSGTFRDPRDGERYPWMRLGGTAWMLRNLAFPTRTSRTYADIPAIGRSYGQLYDWITAPFACPKGWHLPTDMQWAALGPRARLLNLQAAGRGSGLDRFEALGDTGFHWSLDEIDAKRASDWRFAPGKPLRRDASAKEALESVRCVEDRGPAGR